MSATFNPKRQQPSRFGLVALCSVYLLGCQQPPVAPSPSAVPSPSAAPNHSATSIQHATTNQKAGYFPLISTASAIPDAILDLRYARADNFVGTVVDGYQAPRCLLHPPVVAALAKVATAARQQGLRLQLFDCYRPQQAVDHFVRWSRDLTDQHTKVAYYPNLDKSVLLGDYIAERSGHSRGATLDLSLAKQDATGQWQLLDMGTPFDFFDTKANTDSNAITATQRANRKLLLQLMQTAGFANYAMEWWHFTYKPEPTPEQYFNEPVR